MNDNSPESLNNSLRLEQILDVLQGMRTRLEQVETRVDERLRETRPIWEEVHGQLAELKNSVLTESESRRAQVSEFKESVEAQIGGLKDSQLGLRAEMEKSFRLLDRRMEMYAEMVARVHACERDLEDRVDELAKRLT